MDFMEMIIFYVGVKVFDRDFVKGIDKLRIFCYNWSCTRCIVHGALCTAHILIIILKNIGMAQTRVDPDSEGILFRGSRSSQE